MQMAFLLMRAHSLGALAAWGARPRDGVDQQHLAPRMRAASALQHKIMTSFNAATVIPPLASFPVQCRMTWLDKRSGSIDLFSFLGVTAFLSLCLRLADGLHLGLHSHLLLS